MFSVYLLLIVLAILIQAYFTASEMSITSVNRLRLKSLVDEGDYKALKLNEFLHKEGAYLGTTLVGTNITVIISAVLATRIFAEYLGPTVAPMAVTAVMVPVTLIFAEIVPKIIARQFATDFALKSIVLLNVFYRLFLPVILFVNAIARILLMPFGKRTAPWDVTFTKGDLKYLLKLGHESGEVEADEVELIHKVLDFGSKKAGSIMVPLFRVSSISADDTVRNLKRLVLHTGFSRVPVYRKNKNVIVGIANIYDILFSEEGNDDNAKVLDFIREPVRIDREDGLDIALARLRHSKRPMGIVTEGDDKVVGIITIEDVLEEIVGEIEDTGWHR